MEPVTHRALLLVLSGCAMTCVASACSSSYTTPEDFTVTRGGDAGADHQGPASDGDTGVTIDQAGCTTLHVDFSDPTQQWKYSGLADPNGTSVALTRGTGNDVGAIFVPAPPNTASFDVTFTVTASGGNSPQGEGVALVWANNTDAPRNGRGTDALGFCAGSGGTGTPTGYALEYDFLNSVLSLVWSGGGVGSCQLQPPSQSLLFSGSQTFSAHVAATGVTAIAGASSTKFAPMSGVSAIRWIGFTGAGSATVLDVTDVVIKACP